MKTTNFIVSIFVVACLFCIFSCNEKPVEISDINDSDTMKIDSCIPVLPIYYELDKSLFDCMNMERPCDSYNYEIYPQTDSWDLAKFMILSDSLISKELASSMSTQALIQAYWEFPMLSDIIYSVFTGFFNKYMLKNYAYNELIHREDACEALMHRFLLVDHVGYLFDEDGKFTRGGRIAPKGLELLISQPEFLAQYSEIEKKTIISTTLDNYSLRAPLVEIAGHTSFCLIGRVLISAGYQPFIKELDKNPILYDLFFKDSYTRDDAIYRDFITKYAIMFLNEE